MNINQKHEATQAAFLMIERLATLCATPGINEETQKLANKHIQSLLESVVKTAVGEIGAKGVGILI